MDREAGSCQVDFDGTETYFDIVTVNCGSGGFDVTQLYLNSNTLSFNVENDKDEKLEIYLYDAQGRIIANKSTLSTEENTNVKIDNLSISKGIYMLSIVGETNKFSAKLMSNGN